MKKEDVIEQMAKAGYECMFDDKWDDLPKNAIDRHIWYDIAKTMLKSVKFPEELYRICKKLFFET